MPKLALASNCKKRILESIFGVFYVMTEGDHPPAGNARFSFTILLLVLDALQVLRSMGVSTYAWSAYSISILRSVDLVALFFHTVQQVIPEWIFFGISILMAAGAIINAGYVMNLFRAGHVHVIWPLKVLRFLVASIVTVFFSTVLEFLLYPVRCIDMSDESTFSAVFRGKATACSPWNGSELAITVPTVVVAFIFIVFSLITTFLDFTTNPLCMHPLSQCSGRLESLWTLFKVASILLAYLAPYISATACAIILFLLAVFIFVYHATLLPFHHEAVNVMRGGIYLACVMLCLGNIILLHYPDQQGLQNWLLGSVPIAFFIGRFVISYIVSAYNRYLGVLRGQWDEKSKSEMHGRHGHKERRLSMMSEATQVGGQDWERTLHEHFFDVKWKNERRFSSGSAAYVAARVLLQRRNESDTMFLMSLLTQCLKDHPSSQVLSIFHLVVLRYVHKERNQVSAQEKLSKMQSSVFALDHTYVLFTLNKKNVQEGASQTLGKGSISAVNLMEFDQRMEVARKCHRECIIQMKAFWKHVAKRRHSRGKSSTDQALKMTEELDKFTKAKDQAIQEYAWLHEKYPSSAALLSAYANFCDGVINDNKKAEQLRHEVMMMDSYGQEDCIGDEPGMPMMDGTATDTAPPAGMEPDTGNEGNERGAEFRSESSGSQSESFRSQVARNMAGWNHMIMSKDAALLTTLHTQVKWALFFLLTLSLISFVVTDFILFNDVALKTVRNIEETGKFREMAATAPHLLRSQMIESQLDSKQSATPPNGRVNSDTHLYLEIQKELITVTRSMQDQHFKTFEEITTKEIQDFYDDPTILVNIPRPMGWEHVTQSFRHLGTDFARRVASAASATYLEHNDPNFKLAEISTEKRDIAYVFENMIRYLMPAFNEAVGIYERQMDSFGLLCRILTSAGAGLTGLIVIAIGALVLRGRSAVLQRLHANRVTINLALELPRQVSSRFYKFFSELEVDMAIMEDEENDARQRMAAVDIELTRRGGDPRRLSIQSDGGGVKITKGSLKMTPRSTGAQSDYEFGMQDSARTGKGPFDGMQIGATDWRDVESKPQLTTGNVQLLMERTSSPSTNENDTDDASPPPRRTAANEEEGSEYLSLDESEDSQGLGERRVSGRGSSGRIPTSNLRDDEESQTEEEDKDRDESDNEDTKEGGQTRGHSGSGTGSSGGEGGGTSECQYTPRRGNPKRQSLSEAAQGEDVERSPARPLPKLEMSSRRSGRKQGKGSPLDVEEMAQHEEEVSSKLQARKKILRKDSQDDRIPRLPSTPMGDKRSLRFSNSSQNVLEPESEKTVTKNDSMLDSTTLDSQQQQQKDGNAEPEEDENEDSANENEDEPEKGGKKKDHTLDKQAITQEMQDALVLLHFKAQPWYNSFNVYMATLVVVLVLCVLYSVFPARRISSIVNMAPTTNKATERISLARGCIFLARELVMADGLSRMTKAEMSGTLASFIEQYEQVDHAVRLGDHDLGIDVGADHRSKLHNQVMYQLGCPWRKWDEAKRRRASDEGDGETPESPDDCSLPAETYPRAAGDGLFNLQSTFLDSTKAVLRKYGSPQDEYRDIYFQHRTDGEDVSEWTTVNANIEAYLSIKDDPDIRFLEMMFHGDLYTGLQYIVDLFEIETTTLLDDVHRETRVLFVVYITFLLVVFYYALFRTTLENAREEIIRAQEFVFTIPLHILEPDQCDTIKAFYMRDNAETGAELHEPEDHGRDAA